MSSGTATCRATHRAGEILQDFEGFFKTLKETLHLKVWLAGIAICRATHSADEVLQDFEGF